MALVWRGDGVFEGLKIYEYIFKHYTRRQGLYIGAPLVKRVGLVVVVMCVNTGSGGRKGAPKSYRDDVAAVT